MKTIKFLLTAFLFMICSILFAQKTAVVYSTNKFESVVGGAVVRLTYPSTTFYNINTLDSAAKNALITGITDESYHKIFVLVDTSTYWTGNNTDSLQGHLIDTLATKLYSTETDGITPDTAVQFIVKYGTVRSKGERLWDTLHSSLTYPLIVEFTGYNSFSEKRGMAKSTSLDSMVIDSAGTAFVSGAYDGDYVYFRDGNVIGQYKLIDSTDATKHGVHTSADFTAAPTKGYHWVIKRVEEVNELFYDIYAELYIKTYLTDLSSNTVIQNWAKLIDDNNKLYTGTVHLAPVQDLDYLWNTVIAGGQIIFEYLKTL
jgi:hypothetical protein